MTRHGDVGFMRGSEKREPGPREGVSCGAGVAVVGSADAVGTEPRICADFPQVLKPPPDPPRHPQLPAESGVLMPSLQPVVAVNQAVSDGFRLQSFVVDILSICRVESRP